MGFWTVYNKHCFYNRNILNNYHIQSYLNDELSNILHIKCILCLCHNHWLFIGLLERNFQSFLWIKSYNLAITVQKWKIRRLEPFRYFMTEEKNITIKWWKIRLQSEAGAEYLFIKVLDISEKSNWNVISRVTPSKLHFQHTADWTLGQKFGRKQEWEKNLWFKLLILNVLLNSNMQLRNMTCESDSWSTKYQIFI